MSNTFLVQVTHESGVFLARVTAETEGDALVRAENAASERWDLDVVDVHTATADEVAEAQGQVTDLDRDL